MRWDVRTDTREFIFQSIIWNLNCSKYRFERTILGCRQWQRRDLPSAAAETRSTESILIPFEWCWFNRSKSRTVGVSVLNHLNPSSPSPCVSFAIYSLGRDQFINKLLDAAAAAAAIDDDDVEEEDEKDEQSGTPALVLCGIGLWRCVDDGAVHNNNNNRIQTPNRYSISGRMCEYLLSCVRAAALTVSPPQHIYPSSFLFKIFIVMRMDSRT